MNFARAFVSSVIGVLLVTPVLSGQGRSTPAKDSLATTATPAERATFDGKSWWQFVGALASDEMEGRETGSEGLRKAAAYIVDQLQAAGLQPAGEKGFYQDVKLISRQIDESDSSVALIREGKSTPLVLGKYVTFVTRVDLAPNVDAGLVFVGYGLRVPEKGYNDFGTLDLHGKIAVIFSGAPASLPGPLASHYQSLAERTKVLREAGAIGFISIPNPAAMDVPWDRMALARLRPSMSLADPDLDASRGMRLALTFNPEDAEKLFQGSGHSFLEIAALAKERKVLRGFPLLGNIRAHAKVITKEVDSANIVAKYPGTDSSLKSENVVLSAHMDHLGIGEPVNGDRIYNGAMDNASGCALLMDLARSLGTANARFRRSVLFVFVTGEEKGLLGSEYFVERPTVPRGSIVADINIDMFLPLFPFKVLMAFGMAESDLGDTVREIARTQGVEIQSDPMPERNVFIRSDQYSFIKKGVPSLMLGVGFAEGSPQEAVFMKWITERYHSPSDDLDQPVDLAAAGEFEELIYELAARVADTPARPTLKSDSYFRNFATEPKTGH